MGRVQREYRCLDCEEVYFTHQDALGCNCQKLAPDFTPEQLKLMESEFNKAKKLFLEKIIPGYVEAYKDRKWEVDLRDKIGVVVEIKFLGEDYGYSEAPKVEVRFIKWDKKHPCTVVLKFLCQKYCCGEIHRDPISDQRAIDLLHELKKIDSTNQISDVLKLGKAIYKDIQKLDALSTTGTVEEFLDEYIFTNDRAAYLNQSEVKELKDYSFDAAMKDGLGDYYLF